MVNYILLFRIEKESATDPRITMCGNVLTNEWKCAFDIDDLSE